MHSSEYNPYQHVFKIVIFLTKNATDIYIMVEIWQMHVLFMTVFFGLPIGLALYKVHKWRQKGRSIISQIKSDLNMDF